MTNKIWAGLIGLLMVPVVLVVFLVSQPSKGRITVETYHWIGLGEPGQSSEPAVSGPDGPGTRLRTPGPEPVTFLVIASDSEGVTVRSSQPLSVESPEGGFNLSSRKTIFQVRPGQPVRLATPTMDAGTNYTLTLSR